MKAMVASAVPLEDWGFCPVMRLPSTTVCGFQSAALENMPPCSLSLASMRKGTASVSWTAASSESAKPVTFLPATSGCDGDEKATVALGRESDNGVRSRKR